MCRPNRDEPTVGIDPVLREIVWKYLLELTSELGSTVLITTHYIQEAERADKVGFMRNGFVLQEGNPKTLERQYQESNLEDVFYKLCYDDENGNRIDPRHKPSECWSEAEKVPFLGATESSGKLLLAKPQNVVSMRALIHKNLIGIRRQKLFLSFFICLPLVSFLLFNACIGTDPKDLKLSIVNQDSECSSSISLSGVDCYGLFDVVAADLSCLITAAILNQKAIGTLTRRNTTEQALEDVQLGLSYGYLHFPKGFAEQAWTSAIQGSKENGYEMTVRLDASNYNVHQVMKYSIWGSLLQVNQEIEASCVLAKEFKASEIQVLFNSVEDDQNTLTELMQPGLVTIILHFMAVAVTADVLVSEKEAGLLDREVGLWHSNLANLVRSNPRANGRGFSPMVAIVGVRHLLFVPLFERCLYVGLGMGSLSWTAVRDGLRLGDIHAL